MYFFEVKVLPISKCSCHRGMNLFCNVVWLHNIWMEPNIIGGYLYLWSRFVNYCPFIKLFLSLQKKHPWAGKLRWIQEKKKKNTVHPGKAKFKLQLLNRVSREWCWLLLCGELSTRSLQKKTYTQVKKSSFYTPKKTGCTLVDKRKAVEFYIHIT